MLICKRVMGRVPAERILCGEKVSFFYDGNDDIPMFLLYYCKSRAKVMIIPEKKESKVKFSLILIFLKELKASYMLLGCKFTN